MLDQLEKEELLPWLINEYKCKQGIEIGVRDGENAARLLQQTDMILYGVDINKWPQIELLKNAYGRRFIFHHTPSNLASDLFDDGQLDFVYIDACHDYESVMQDIIIWYPKLKVGGVFSGDDYCNCWNPVEGYYGIEQAVEDFIYGSDIELHISGLGVVDRETRIAYANRIGKLHEDNLVLGAIGSGVNISPELAANRVRTEGVPVPQWWFIKKE